jgi:glycosyltransferase involved in cell wall biosynthesis
MGYTVGVKIALVTGSAGDTRCGVGDYTFELAQHLALDADVTLYHAAGHGPASPPFERLTTLELRKVSGFSAITIAWLARKIAEEGYDIVHLQYPSKGFGSSVGPGFLPQRLAGMHSRSRIVVTLHEWTTSHPLRRMVMDQMLPSADLLIVTNERELSSLVKRAHKRVEVIPVGNVLTSRHELENVWLKHEGKDPWTPDQPSGPRGRKSFSIFHYGLPAKGKGLDRLLEALKIVRAGGIKATLDLGGDFKSGTPLSEELLEQITKYELFESVNRLGHLEIDQIAPAARQCQLGVFPFDEGYSSKRSSIAGITHVDLPLVVGAGSAEDHPFWAPEENTAESLAVLLVELFSGRLESEWTTQVKRQQEYGKRFSFAQIARQHLDAYREQDRDDR